jgi:hypothetical protein
MVLWRYRWCSDCIRDRLMIFGFRRRGTPHRQTEQNPLKFRVRVCKSKTPLRQLFQLSEAYLVACKYYAPPFNEWPFWEYRVQKSLAGENLVTLFLRGKA